MRLSLLLLLTLHSRRCAADLGHEGEDSCISSLKTACSVTTAQNLGLQLQADALGLASHSELEQLFNDISSGARGEAEGGFGAVVLDFQDTVVAAAPSAPFGAAGQGLAAALAGSGVVSAPSLGAHFQTAAMSGGTWVSFAAVNGTIMRAWVMGFPPPGEHLPMVSFQIWQLLQRLVHRAGCQVQPVAV